jgi:cytosine/uracil/thiamine/allantoin permease
MKRLVVQFHVHMSTFALLHLLSFLTALNNLPMVKHLTNVQSLLIRLYCLLLLLLLFVDFNAKLGRQDIFKVHSKENIKQKNYTQCNYHTSSAAVHGGVTVQSGASQEWHLYFLRDEDIGIV